MQKIEIAYGRGTQTCTIPDSVQCTYGKLKQVEPEQQAEDQVATALAHLVGNINEDKLRTAKSVAIAISETIKNLRTQSEGACPGES